MEVDQGVPINRPYGLARADAGAGVRVLGRVEQGVGPEVRLGAGAVLHLPDAGERLAAQAVDLDLGKGGRLETVAQQV